MQEPRFKLVLQSVERTRASAVRYELSRLLDIDEDIASDIVGASPIVLVRELLAPVAVALKQRMRPAIDKGAQLVITDAPCEEIPKVNWPELPEIVRAAQQDAERAAVATASSQQPPARSEPATPAQPAPAATSPPPRTGPPGSAAPPAPAAAGGQQAALVAEFCCPRCREPLRVVAAGAGGSGPVARPLPPVSELVPAPAASPPPAAAPAPVAAAPAPAPAARRLELDEGPLVRALQEKRQLRESQRLLARQAGRGAGAEPARPAPAAPSGAEPPPAAGVRPHAPVGEQADQGSPSGRAGASGSAPAGRLGQSGEPAPAAAEPTRHAQAAGVLDIEEALRLLDNVIEEPAPLGVEAAPPPGRAEPGPPAPAAAAAPPLLDSDISDFADLDSELEELGGALGLGPPSEDATEPPRQAAAPVAPPPASPPPPRAPLAAPAPSGSPSSSASGSSLLEPLDPQEALAILESARSPDSSDEMIFERPARGPVSEELQPLAPEEALALLARSTAAAKGRATGRASPPGPTPAAPAASLPTSGATAGSGRQPSSPASDRRPGSAGSARSRPTQPSDDDPVHGLVLSRITSEAKRQKAAELIAEITGMSRQDALDLTRRTIVPVLKGVDRRTAEQALERFQRSKISGRVTTRRLGS
ncbi:MAG: hypothetical protein KatS3mg102_1504 [Planctomycetota bacterium]|nr:MAG: hypothetical protein KatS3mg102_1504 [Planctomycetota bacterium]